MFKNGTYDFLTFDAELVDTFRKWRSGILRLGFHCARELFKFTGLSIPPIIYSQKSYKLLRLLLAGCRGFGQAWSGDWMQKRHHGSKFRTQLLNGMGLLALSGSQKVRATLLVFLNPFFGEAAVANLGENFAHFFFGLGIDDARPGTVIALLRSVTDGIAHVA